MISLADLSQLLLRGYTFATAGNVYTEAVYTWHTRVRYVLSDTALYILSPDTVAYTYVPANVLTPLPCGIPEGTRGTLTFRTVAGVATVQMSLYYLPEGSVSGS